MRETGPVPCGSVSRRAGSLGVRMHNAGYAALGLGFRYVAISTEHLGPVVASLRDLGFRGFAVSMPFKVDVLRHLDGISPDAAAIGACNTVVQQDGALTGYNTDWTGALAALDEQAPPPLASATVIGSGGVARALCFGLKQRGLQVFVAARSAERRRALVRDLGLDGDAPLGEQGEPGSPLVVNATPAVGWPGAAVDLERHRQGAVLLDVVAEPWTTPLAAEAARRGWKVVPGWRMLLHQAVRQFELYTGRPAPFEVMESALGEALPPAR